ncbi:MAG: riboflavin synthase [Deltaproteobacteria bacterium]|nr:riboflavin synthase [Deltaproteobacteria bacterium]
MFTGLVEATGEIARAEPRAGSLRLVVRSPLEVDALGASVAVDGACFTVVERGAGTLAFDVGPESLARTVAGSYRAGTRVNLERALAAGARLGGHFVLGHVDALGTLERISPRGDARDLLIRAGRDVMDLTPPKGSITVNGISLTVNASHGETFEVSIIPHTWERTMLGTAREGDRVNLETDVLARTVAWLLARRGTVSPAGLTVDKLKEAGFL